VSLAANIPVRVLHRVHPRGIYDKSGKIRPERCAFEGITISAIDAGISRA
jgi:hypothetical protein